MGPDGQPDQAPGQKDVRVMPLGFRQFADSVGELERLPEILELLLLFQVVLLQHTPASSHLLR